MYSEQSGQDFMGGAGVISFYPTGGSADDECQNLVTFGHTQGIDPQVSESATPTLRKNGGGAAIAFRKSKRAQTDQDDETLVDDGAANTLNRFDQGDTRTTHMVVNALDRQAGGPDDNSAQANHLVPDQTTVRRLTPLECERLMGLPDGWTAPVGVKAPDSKRYAACGDAIVTWVAYWIAQRIRMIEEEA
jgi:DNA (cytosine-5)-methyltransferase 1